MSAAAEAKLVSLRKQEMRLVADLAQVRAEIRDLRDLVSPVNPVPLSWRLRMVLAREPERDWTAPELAQVLLSDGWVFTADPVGSVRRQLYSGRSWACRVGYGRWRAVGS